jgi:probable rRNA maturation factor
LTLDPLPHLCFSHRAKAAPYNSAVLEHLAAASLPLCLALAKENTAPLAGLDSLDISILGARAMARVHRDFLDISGATDVITFPYGEILVCAPIAASRAPEFGHSTTTELALYIIHGFLHLSGYDDTNPLAAKTMADIQSHILSETINPR